MDAPGLLVVVLGLAAGTGLVAAVLGWQRAALAVRRVAVLERSQEARRGTVARLAEVARTGWQGETFTARGDGAGQAAGVGFGGASVASTTSTTAMPCG